jgi:CheY-like chemotaxis protein
MIDAAFGGRVDITYALTDEIPYIYEKEGSIESFLVQFALLFSSFLTEKSKILIETGRDVDLKEKRIECYISARVSNTNPPPHNIEKMFSDIDNKQKEFLSLNLLKKKGVLEIFCRRTSIVFKYKLKGMDKIASFKEWRGETFSEGYGRILLIEEENALREAIRVNLERVGFTVLQAESLSKARKIIEATEGKFGLIISDYVLTDGNAVEFAKMNIEKISDRLLFLSSLSFKELGVDEELKDFRIDFLLKPFKRVDLIKKVKSLMEN